MNILQNFLFVLKRFKTSAVLNIIGLTVALAVFIITAIQFHYDFSFDRNFKNSDKIYEFTFLWRGFGQAATTSMPVGKKVAEEFTEIENYCLIDRNPRQNVKLQENDEETLQTKSIYATAGFLDVFTPKIIAGDAASVFSGPDKTMITEDIAQTYFKDKNPLGELLFVGGEQTPVTIEAICERFPDNCSLENGVYLLAPEDENIGNLNYRGFFLINPLNYATLSKKLKEYVSPETMRVIENIEFIPLPDIRFNNSLGGRGNRTTTLSFLAIGIITLLIAFINFMNFSIALIPARIKNVNIQKILGESTRKRILLMASEAPCFALLSFLLSFLLIEVFKTTPLTEFFSANLSLEKYKLLLFALLIGVFVLIFLIALYPAIKATSIKPAMALAGTFSRSKQSVLLRDVLVSFQFLAAISLIIISFFVKIQHDYMVGYDWGIQKENIVCFLGGDAQKNKVLDAEFRKLPDVLDVTSAEDIPGSIGRQTGTRLNEEKIMYKNWYVKSNFPDFFGVKVNSGRNFISTDDGKGFYIVNESFVEKYGLDEQFVGHKLNGEWGEVIGIAENVIFESLHKGIEPMAFQTENEYYRWIIVKINNNNVSQTINQLKKITEEEYGWPINPVFLDDHLTALYKNESNLAKLISIFGVIAILIAIMGVYGLIVFNTRYKKKEIAIRKVNGSTTGEIMLMLNRNIMTQLLISFIIAVPLSYTIVKMWLENFSHKTSIYWWVFLLGGIIVLLITVITVSFQSYRSAIANPTKALND